MDVNLIWLGHQCFKERQLHTQRREPLSCSTPPWSNSDYYGFLQLQDIFRIQVDTPSNTHDLLECPCDEGHNHRIQTLEASVFSDFEASRADLDTLDDSDDSIGERGFVNATQVTPSYLGKLDKAVSVITLLQACWVITISSSVSRKEEGCTGCSWGMETYQLLGSHGTR